MINPIISKTCVELCVEKNNPSEMLVNTSFSEGLRGERGIRTPGGLHLNGFQDRRNRPLCHLSGNKSTKFFLPAKEIMDCPCLPGRLRLLTGKITDYGLRITEKCWQEVKT